MRPGSIVGKVHSGTSVRSAPSIPRREAAQMFAQTKLGFSQLVVKIEWGVAYLERVRGNAVKTPQAELDLAEYFDTARVWVEQLMQRRDKSLLRAIFDTDTDAIELLAHLESLCFKVELKVSNDKRRWDLVQRIAACNEVLADLGYADQLRDAKLREGAAAPGGQDAGTAEGSKDEVPAAEEAVPHLADAAFFGSQAVAFEQVLDFAAAAETYGKAGKSLQAAILVCQAVVRLKASIGASESLLGSDLQQLQRLERQTDLRREHLQSLEPGTKPAPLEEQIQPVDLSIHKDFKFARNMVHAYAGLGVMSGVGVGPFLHLVGPFGLVLLAGATVGTAVGIAFAKHDEAEGSRDGVRKVLHDIGNFAGTIGEPLAKTCSSVAKAGSCKEHRVAPALAFSTGRMFLGAARI